MTLEEQIRNYRKQASMSQEKMAELIGVSRQAITKWENGTGTPDIANLVAIAELFHISLDELLLNVKKEKKQSEYLYESTTEYDIDGIKNFDIKLGSVHTVILGAYEGEKIKVSLSSNIIKGLQSDYKIKIEDKKVTISFSNFKVGTKKVKIFTTMEYNNFKEITSALASSLFAYIENF